MSIGYTGYAKIDTSGTTPANLLLCNSTGLNRKIDPIMSRAVWGAGWANAASTVAYANSQQHFEGGLAFDLQYSQTIWNLFSGWLTTARATPISVQIAPSGFINYLYARNNSDPQSGCWLNRARLTISPERLITVDADCIALKRVETVTATGSNYATNLRTNVALPGSFTSLLDNPSPFNQNPIPGWYAGASVTWPNAPAFWQSGSVPYGLVLLDANITVNNKVQVIMAATGQPFPVAVLVGTVEASGDMTLWRDGAIQDPYGDSNNPSTFTAKNANIQFSLAGSANSIVLNNIVLREDTYNVSGQDDKVPRVFGFYGLGDGTNLPCVLNALS